ncbi:MAG: hypothetical protein CMD31_13090 [Flavobacteriales bacterium]|jgi:hypothetical protein|nr:hypothetical protein [Flavobacteriales bacterium]|tara:strand:- start:38766 stop:38993 length:228 start_codon:yes stop_codon:yes gene_type:complete
MNILAQIIEQDYTVDGNLPQGFLFASIKNTGAQIATVNGINLPPGEEKTYPFVGKGYPQFPFVVNGSTLKVMMIV